MAWLAQETILRIHGAIISAGFQRETLLSGIPPAIVSLLTKTLAPREQWLQDLNGLNEMHQAEQLRTLLTTACHLSQQQESPDASVFADALSELAASIPAPSTGTYTSAPRLMHAVAKWPVPIIVLAMGLGALGWLGYQRISNLNTDVFPAEILIPRLKLTSPLPSSSSVRQPVPSTKPDLNLVPPAKKVAVVITAFSGTRISISGGPTKASGTVKDSGSISKHDSASFQLLPGDYTITCFDDTGEVITRKLVVKREASDVISASCIGN